MKSLLRIVLGFLVPLALFCCTVFSYVVREQADAERERMRLGLEDVASRVRKTADNLTIVRQFSDAAAITKARSLAQIVEYNPSVVTNQPMLEAIVKMLDVDELHISDSNGVLIGCVPASCAGLDMHLNAQTRAFLPALTDKTFELAQDPAPADEILLKSDSSRLFQFVGVARRDTPGIVQIGQCATRIEQARKLADVDEISQTSRIGRRGKVSIVPLDGLPPARDGFAYGTDSSGSRTVSLESDCAGYRIVIVVPDPYWFIESEITFRVLISLCFLMTVGWLFVSTHFRRKLMADSLAVRELFFGVRGGSLWRTIRSPVLIVCIMVFSLAIVICWLVSDRMAKTKAQDMLLSAADDMRDVFDTGIDMLLYCQGNAICRYYRTPSAFEGVSPQDVLRRYGIDEFNAVGADGLTVADSLGDIGFDMGAHPETVGFNCLLDGKTRFYAQPFRSTVEDASIRRKYAGIAFPPPAHGYLQIGIDESRILHDLDYWFADQATHWHVGKSGFYIIAKDETGEINSCGGDAPDMLQQLSDGATLAGIGFDVERAPREPNRFFVSTLFGRECLCLTEVRAFHRIVTALPMAEVRGGTIRIVLITAGVLFAVMVLIAVFMTRLSELVTKLKGFIAADKERQLKDLTLAKTIQVSALPVMMSPEVDYRIMSSMMTAREVGGDFYDFYPLPNGKIVFLVADVSGKGVPAALFMMRAKALIRSAVIESERDLAYAVELANNYLSNQNDAEMFVTAWIATYDRESGVIEYVNAGHNPPLIRRADGSVEWVRGRGGLVLAAMGGMKYRSNSCRLECGDIIYLYTDGVTEAMNVAGGQFGEDRLEGTLSKSGGERIIGDVGRAVASFTAGAEQSDDITMLVLERLNSTKSMI